MTETCAWHFQQFQYTTHSLTHIWQLATELIKCFTWDLPFPPSLTLPPPSLLLFSFSPLCSSSYVLHPSPFTCNLMPCLRSKVKSGKQFSMKVFNLCKFCVSVCVWTRVCVCGCCSMWMYAYMYFMPASLINFPLTQRTFCTRTRI